MYAVYNKPAKKHALCFTGTRTARRRLIYYSIINADIPVPGAWGNARNTTLSTVYRRGLLFAGADRFIGISGGP